MSTVTLRDMHLFLGRELRRHERTNAQLVATGKMTEDDAASEMLALRGLEHLVRGMMDRPALAAQIRAERQEKIAQAKAARNRQRLDGLSLAQVFGGAGRRP